MTTISPADDGEQPDTVRCPADEPCELSQGDFSPTGEDGVVYLESRGDCIRWDVDHDRYVL